MMRTVVGIALRVCLQPYWGSLPRLVVQKLGEASYLLDAVGVEMNAFEVGNDAG